MEPTQPHTVSTAIIAGLAFLFAMLLLAGAWYYLFGRTAETGTHAELYERLIVENPSFAEGEQNIQQGDYAKAVQSHRQAYATLDDSLEKIKAQTMVAQAKQRDGDFTGSIADFKTVAAENIAGAARPRAYAAMQIARMYFYHSAEPAVTAEIFADEPYASFLVPGNKAETQLQLFQYAAALYPLAGAVLQVANSYANGLVAPGANLTELDVANRKDQIRQSLVLAEADMAYMREDGHLQSLLSSALLARALVL